MPHFTEDTVTRLRDRITEGAHLVRRYWPDDSTPSGASFLKAEAVTFDADGWVTITTREWNEKNGRYAKVKHSYGPDDVVAVVEMKPLGDTGAETYAHNDSRLTLAGGHMDARPGGNLRAWDVYRADGALLAEGVGTAEGRALLAEEAPEMIWVHHGDGKWNARGHGRHWKIQRGRRNPDYDPHTSPTWQWWLYDLLARPLDGGEWKEIKTDSESPQQAREAAPAPQAADEATH